MFTSTAWLYVAPASSCSLPCSYFVGSFSSKIATPPQHQTGEKKSIERKEKRFPNKVSALGKVVMLLLDLLLLLILLIPWGKF